MKKLLLFLFISISFNAAADDDDLVEYMDNGLPKHYELLDGKKPIYIEFTDIIQGRLDCLKNLHFINGIDQTPAADAQHTHEASFQNWRA